MKQSKYPFDDISEGYVSESNIRDQMLEIEAQAILDGLRDYARTGDIPDMTDIVNELEMLRQEIADLRERVDVLENA